MEKFTHRERVLSSLNHKEPDRIPFDLNGTGCSGIHYETYIKLRYYLGLPKVQIKIADKYQGRAELDEDFINLWDLDIMATYIGSPTKYMTGDNKSKSSKNIEITSRDWEDENYYYSEDIFGIVRRKPKKYGHYYDFYKHPLVGDNIEDIKNYSWPDPKDPRMLENLNDKIRSLQDKGYAVTITNWIIGSMTYFMMLQGFNNGNMNFASSPKFVDAFLDKILEIELQNWEFVFNNLAVMPDVIFEGDDLAGQDGLLFSLEMINRYFKPRYKILYSYLKKRSPKTKILFHICGAIRDIIPMLIEVGVDCINPVQVSAKGMEDTKKLKKDYGSDLVFWGGGIDTQKILNKGTPAQVKEEVKRRIEDLSPGGGFIFAAVHNIEPDVPPQNLIAMWEAFKEYS